MESVSRTRRIGSQAKRSDARSSIAIRFLGVRRTGRLGAKDAAQFRGQAKNCKTPRMMRAQRPPAPRRYLTSWGNQE